MTRQIKVFATYITASYWYPEYANNHNSARQHHMKYTNTKSQQSCIHILGDPKYSDV